MKELTIEEKAKRYDEAINIAKSKIKNDKDHILYEDIIEIFSELKEKTDEEIIQKLISIVHLYYGEGVDSERNECLEWLEKQSKNKPIERKEFTGIPFGTFDSELYEQMITIPNGCVATIEGNKIHIKKKDNSAIEAIKLNHTVDNNEMVESTFKVGDWVVRTNGKSFCNGSKFAQIQSIELDGEMCYLDTGRWLYPSEIRHWSIEDAKDGDVLVSLSKMHPFIFNGHYDEDTDYVYAYCGISDIIKDDSFYFDKYPNEEFKVWDSVENVRPATRDQRNLLFSKMKDSGYEWDSKKKELIKTEQV